MIGPFPGATSVSCLDVYTWDAPDGLAGGTPHLHLTCSEGYVVIGGSGRVQTLSADGFRETELRPETVVWFGPGVIHRLVNDGDLRIVVVMQNNGLPEAGDAVMTFPPEYLEDPERYRQVAVLPSTDAAEAARRRQALAVDGFTALRRRYETEGATALDSLHAAAGRLVHPKVEAWRATWRDGPLAAAHRTGEQLDALEAGDTSHLREGSVASVQPAPRFGMCGRLSTYQFPLGRSGD
jgi:hypothetical protein